MKEEHKKVYEECIESYKRELEGFKAKKLLSKNRADDLLAGFQDGMRTAYQTFVGK